jgi:hypothetical protein
VRCSGFSLLALGVWFAAVGCREDDDEPIGLHDLRLAEDDGVLAIAWMRDEPEGLALHTQIGESEPLSWEPQPSWSPWRPELRFAVNAGHRWQLVWGRDEGGHEQHSTFLIHDGVTTNLDARLENRGIDFIHDVELLARTDDTAVMVLLAGPAGLRPQALHVLQIDGNAEILSSRRLDELEADRKLGHAYKLHATLVGEDLIVGLATPEDVAVRRGPIDGIGEVVDIGIDGAIMDLWADAAHSRVLIRQIEPNVIVVDVGQGAHTLAPDSGSACDQPHVGAFLPNGEAMAVFAGESSPGVVVVSESHTPWAWDVDASSVTRALGTDAGLLVVIGEIYTQSRAKVVLLDPSAREAVPLLDVDLTPDAP